MEKQEDRSEKLENRKKLSFSDRVEVRYESNLGNDVEWVDIRSKITTANKMVNKDVMKMAAKVGRIKPVQRQIDGEKVGKPTAPLKAWGIISELDALGGSQRLDSYVTKLLDSYDKERVADKGRN